MKNMKTMIFASLFTLSLSALAESPPEGFTIEDSEAVSQTIKVEKGIQILVDDYDSSAKAYNFTILADQAPGPNFVTIEELSSAIIGFSPDKIEKNPKDLVGEKFVLQKDITLATAAALSERVTKGKNGLKPAVKSQSVFVSLDDYEALKINKNTEVKVDSYDPQSKTFSLIMTKYPAQGPNYTTLGHLGEAVKELHGKTSDYAKNPKSLEGKTFKLNQDLKLISEDEVAEREEEFSAKNRFFKKTPASSGEN